MGELIEDNEIGGRKKDGLNLNCKCEGKERNENIYIAAYCRGGNLLGS